MPKAISGSTVCYFYNYNSLYLSVFAFFPPNSIVVLLSTENGNTFLQKKIQSQIIIEVCGKHKIDEATMKAFGLFFPL